MSKNYKILVVDDEEEWLDLIKDVLKKENYNVLTANSGKRAIELIKKSEFDVIILDIRMESEFQGIEVLDHVKNAQPATPVIMLTAYATIQNAKDSMKKGAFDFIVKGEKGSSNEELRKKVQDALHYLYFDSLKQEIISILKSNLEIEKIELVKNVQKNEKTKIDKFNIVLEDMKRNEEIAEDGYLIKYKEQNNQ